MLFAKNIALSFGTRDIVHDANFGLREGERVALLGDNGAGKSTLMSILMSRLAPDGGSVTLNKNATLGMLAQEPELDLSKSPRELAASGLQGQRDLLAKHESLCTKAGEDASADVLKELESVTAQIEASGGFDIEHRVDEVISRLNVPVDSEDSQKLSGGERRRLDLARVLLSNPDVLLLDEPTNHLDRGAIRYLAELLKKRTGALMFTSHDRAFVDDVSTTLLELDHGELFTHSPPYDAFVERRLERKMVEGKTLQRRKRLLAREVAWSKTSPKARTTKQNARLERAADLVEEVGAAVKKQRKKTLEVKRAGSARLAKTILEFKKVGLAVPHKSGEGERVLVKDLELILTEGERWGIVGDNGAGKTTLLRAVLGEHPLHAGEIVKGGRTKITVFDQHKADLDVNSRLDEVLAEGDHVHIGEERVHVCTYLERFLFDPKDRARKVATLSGGERNRLWLARLFREDSNCLLLDEPTNDLDVETLSVLEEVLLEHKGVALIVSHDQRFLDRVCTGILGFHEGEVTPVQGDYTQYQKWLDDKERAAAKEAPKDIAVKVVQKKAPKKKVKRSYNEEREYSTIEARIAEAESARDRLQKELESPEVASDASRLTELASALAEQSSLVETLFERWQVLEEIGS